MIGSQYAGPEVIEAVPEAMLHRDFTSMPHPGNFVSGQQSTSSLASKWCLLRHSLLAGGVRGPGRPFQQTSTAPDLEAIVCMAWAGASCNTLLVLQHTRAGASRQIATRARPLPRTPPRSFPLSGESVSACAGEGSASTARIQYRPSADRLATSSCELELGPEEI